MFTWRTILLLIFTKILIIRSSNTSVILVDSVSISCWLRKCTDAGEMEWLKFAGHSPDTFTMHYIPRFCTSIYKPVKFRYMCLNKHRKYRLKWCGVTACNIYNYIGNWRRLENDTVSHRIGPNGNYKWHYRQKNMYLLVNKLCGTVRCTDYV